MGWIVTPLFVLEGISAVLVAITLFPLQAGLQIASLALFLTGAAVTFGIFVPLHHKLQKTLPPPGEWTRLSSLNWIRTSLSSGRLLVVLFIHWQAAKHVH